MLVIFLICLEVTRVVAWYYHYHIYILHVLARVYKIILLIGYAE